MNQQVNLFQPMLRRERQSFSPRAMLQSLGLALAGMLAISGYQYWQTRQLAHTVGLLEQQRQTAAHTLASAQAKLPAPQPSARLADEITRLTRAIGEREELVKVLSDRLDISQNGLARFLEGLARQRVDGLWLTGVSVADGGRDIVIKGQALQPQLIPVLVQRLADEASFEGVKFRELRMHRPDGNAGRIEFELRTLGKAKTS